MQEFTTDNEWEQLLKLSHTKPVLIFKHSEMCPISSNAYRKMETGLATGVLNEPVHFMSVQKCPQLKMRIAEETGITHESPQAIVLQDGNVVYHASHDDIEAEKVAKFFPVATE